MVEPCLCTLQVVLGVLQSLADLAISGASLEVDAYLVSKHTTDDISYPLPRGDCMISCAVWPGGPALWQAIRHGQPHSMVASTMRQANQGLRHALCITCAASLLASCLCRMPLQWMTTT